MPIRRLPALLVNQIAAGEVIERPASVVKEAVENSIDAGAERIDVTIDQGGCELIRIADNGCGIPMAELALALAPHATSKLAAAEDLDAIATMGFRGEALASIASVSRLSMVSRPVTQDAAALIEAEGEIVSEPRPTSGAVGTALTVRNLFFNTPARRKFLRTEQTEATRITDILENLALAHPSIAFSLRVDDRLRFELPPRQTAAERVIAVVGRELQEELLELHADERGISMWGMIGKPSIARGTAKHMRLFLNGRMINDRSIAHAIKEAYRGLIDPGRHPTVLLFLTIDPAQVDVNVHPTKAEVRFRNQSAVHSAVLGAIRRRLREADLLPELELTRSISWSDAFQRDERSFPGGPDFGPHARNDVEHATGTAPSQVEARRFVEHFQRLDPVQKGFVYSEVRQAVAREGTLPAADVEILPPGAGPLDRSTTVLHDAAAGDARPLPMVRSVADILQVHSSYLITQDAQGLVIIDQHALHERVMFEKLKARLGTGDLESQRLLLPAVVNVDRTQVELLNELQPLLKRLGIEAEPMGPASIAVHAFTSLLFERGVDPVSFMSELLDKSSTRGVNTDPEAALHEVLDMMACKAAVKAGDRLAPEELAELLNCRETIERASSCPHGRPTSLRLSLKELERQFGRT